MASSTPLQTAWTFWYHRKSKTATESYEDSVKSIASFRTVEEFWQIYNHLRRPDQLMQGTDYHLFREGVKPTWEDEQNRTGGKFIMRLKKGLVSRYWEELTIALIGEQLSDSPADICGAVVSIRYSEDAISIWNRNAQNDVANGRIRQMARKLLRIPSFVKLEYKAHEDSIYDNKRDEWRRSRANGEQAGADATKPGATPAPAAPPGPRARTASVPAADAADADAGWKLAQRRGGGDRQSGGISFRREGGHRSYNSGAPARGEAPVGRTRNGGSWGNREDGREHGVFMNPPGSGTGERSWGRREKGKGDEVMDWRRRS